MNPEKDIPPATAIENRQMDAATSLKGFLKDLRVSIDKDIQEASTIRDAIAQEGVKGGREVSLAITKLQEAKMWVGVSLGEIGNKLPEEYRDEYKPGQAKYEIKSERQPSAEGRTTRPNPEEVSSDGEQNTTAPESLPGLFEGRHVYYVAYNGRHLAGMIIGHDGSRSYSAADLVVFTNMPDVNGVKSFGTQFHQDVKYSETKEPGTWY